MSRVKYLLFISVVAPLLFSCASSNTNSKTAGLQNPYILKATNHTSNGMAAMQKERWEAAIRSFERALTSSQLADHMQLTIQSWYNLANAYSSAQKPEKAEEAYAEVIDLAYRHQHHNMQLRATLARALMQLRLNRLPESFKLNDLPPSLFSKNSWPHDLHLQAGRLAHRLERPQLAAAAYTLISKSKPANRTDKLIKAEAYMGLALLAHKRGDNQSAWRNAEQTLIFCREIGAARLSAHALLLQGKIAQGQIIRLDRLERAIDIYRALRDDEGEKDALTQLLQLIDNPGNHAVNETLRLRLKELEDKLGQ